MNLHRLLLNGGLALVLAAGAVSPLRGGDREPQQAAQPHSIEELKAAIEGDNRNHPDRSVAWAEQGLSQLGPTGAVTDRLWFLAALSRDHNLLSHGEKALEVARQGQRLVGPSGVPLERARFGILATRALLALERPQDALAEFQTFSPLLPTLAAAPEAPARLQAAQGYRTQGGVFLGLGKLPEAMEGYTKSLRLYDALKDARGQALSLDAIASIHSQSSRFEEAKAATLQAIELAKTTGDEGLLAGFHLSLANTCGRLGDPDLQLKELEIARTLALRSHDDGTALTVTVNLADVALSKKDYPATLRNAEAALILAEKAQDGTSLAVCQINKGIALNRMGRPGGLAFIQLGLDRFKQVGAQNYVTEIMGILAEEHAFNRDFEKAYLAHVEFKRQSDLVLRQDDQKRIAEAQASYGAEKKQREIEALQKDQRTQARFRNLWLLAGALGLSAAGILVMGRKKLQAANRALEDMALRDPLTGLANRRYLTTRIDEDLAQIRRLHRSVSQADVVGKDRVLANIDVVFMMLDIDHFKQVNDQHGHASGDAVLKQFAKILGKTLRDSDTVVRWGGEEFFVVAKHASRMDAHILAERIRRNVANHAFDLGNGSTIHKTCSIGFACYPFQSDGSSPVAWETIVEMADQCLYAAKHSGRDMWVGIRPQDQRSDAPPISTHGWMDVAEWVRAGSIEASCTEGRTLSWPD